MVFPLITPGVGDAEIALELTRISLGKRGIREPMQVAMSFERNFLRVRRIRDTYHANAQKVRAYRRTLKEAQRKQQDVEAGRDFLRRLLSGSTSKWTWSKAIEKRFTDNKLVTVEGLFKLMASDRFVRAFTQQQRSYIREQIFRSANSSTVLPCPDEHTNWAVYRERHLTDAVMPELPELKSVCGEELTIDDFAEAYD